MSEERLGFVGVVIEDRQSVPKVNEILSSFAAMIDGRMGVPSPSRGQAVICLIVRSQPNLTQSNPKNKPTGGNI